MVATAALLVSLGFALAQFPNSLAAAIALERGQRAERAGDFALAEAEYGKVVRQFPDSTLALARYGIAAYRAGDRVTAERAFGNIDGRESSPELVKEVNEIVEQMNASDE